MGGGLKKARAAARATQKGGAAKPAAPPKAVEEKLVAAVNKKLKRSVAAIAAHGGMPGEVKEVIPTGIDVLDRFVIGCGGLPGGRASEVFGVESSGKSAFALHCLAAVQHIGGLGILCETERATLEARAKVYGVDLDKLIIVDAEVMEDAIQNLAATMNAIPAGVGPALVVWDSVAATPCRSEIDGGVIGEAGMGERARIASAACRGLIRVVEKKRIHLMFVNQVRENIGGFGFKLQSPTGHGIKHYASVRLMLFQGSSVKDGSTKIGQDAVFTAVKNKVAMPGRKAEVRLRYETGWDSRWSTVAFARDHGMLPEDAAVGEETVAKAKEALGWTG